MLGTLSELDAINIILSSVGNDLVNSLDDEVDVDIANAKNILELTSRNIQRKGWDFNTYRYTMYPDVYTKKILWDNRIIKFSSEDGNTYAKRGNYLYNMSNQTDEYDREVVLTAIMALDFEDLPDCFKSYIAARAAIDFQSRYFGDQQVSQDLQYNMQEAYQDIVQYDMDMGNYNMLNLTNVSSVLERS
ncbi:MAG: hypothetical protein KHX13_04875 [Acidaminococcus intestini]|uniref:Tail tubular protein A n=1 Tax=Acidaminococcus intestini TaxID=187327 RepID=A0A943I190_9FIRM|nr:hypothetical protein [Acidaminococcus intestini]